jgi:hypothetical protein
MTVIGVLRPIRCDLCAVGSYDKCLFAFFRELFMSCGTV